MKRTTILTLLTLMTAICTYAVNDNMRKMTPCVSHGDRFLRIFSK